MVELDLGALPQPPPACFSEATMAGTPTAPGVPTAPGTVVPYHG
jgi:hypothetical protein